MIEQLKTDYPIQVICEVIGYSRSRYDYRTKSDKQKQEEDLTKAIIDVAGRHPTYGYRRGVCSRWGRGVSPAIPSTLPSSRGIGRGVGVSGNWSPGP